MKLNKEELTVLIDALEGNIGCMQYNLNNCPIKSKIFGEKLKKLETSKKLLEKAKAYEPDSE